MAGCARNPGTTARRPMHPTVFRLTVGFLARRLLRAGSPDEVKSVRACMELTLQVYNSTLAPAGVRPPVSPGVQA